MTSAELIQFGEQIANLHRRRIKDAPRRGGSPALRRRQATVERFPDYGGDRCTTLPRESANPLVALIVDENLQPVRQHAHTLACAYSAGGWIPMRAVSLMILFHLLVREVVVEHGDQYGRDGDSARFLRSRCPWLDPVRVHALAVRGAARVRVSVPSRGGADDSRRGARRWLLQGAARRSASSRRAPPERDRSGPPRSSGTGPWLARETLAGHERWP